MEIGESVFELLSEVWMMDGWTDRRTDGRTTVYHNTSRLKDDGRIKTSEQMSSPKFLHKKNFS